MEENWGNRVSVDLNLECFWEVLCVLHHPSRAFFGSWNDTRHPEEGEEIFSLYLCALLFPSDCSNWLVVTGCCQDSQLKVNRSLWTLDRRLLLTSQPRCSQSQQLAARTGSVNKHTLNSDLNGLCGLLLAKSGISPQSCVRSSLFKLPSLLNSVIA